VGVGRGQRQHAARPEDDPEAAGLGERVADLRGHRVGRPGQERATLAEPAHERTLEAAMRIPEPGRGQPIVPVHRVYRQRGRLVEVDVAAVHVEQRERGAPGDRVQHAAHARQVEARILLRGHHARRGGLGGEEEPVRAGLERGQRVSRHGVGDGVERGLDRRGLLPQILDEPIARQLAGHRER
jgi:hypothetical protein